MRSRILLSLVVLLVVGFACVAACTDKREVGTNTGQPFGPCPAGADCSGSNWQNEQTNYLQHVPILVLADAGTNAVLTLTDAGTLVLEQPSYPAFDGGLPAGTPGQAIFYNTSAIPAGTTITGDLSCSTVTPGKCTLVAINGTTIDAGGASTGYVLTWSDAGYYLSAAAFTPGRDLIACDGGQCLVSASTDGAAPLMMNNPGLTVNPAEPGYTILQAAPASSTTAPIGIELYPAGPPTGAATTATGTPSSVDVFVQNAVSTGNVCPGVKVWNQGNVRAQMGPCNTASTSDGCLTLGAGGDAGTTPSNYTIRGSGSLVDINNPCSISSNNCQIDFTFDTTNAMQVVTNSGTPALVAPEILIWPETFTGGVLLEGIHTSDSPTNTITVGVGQDAFPGAGATNVNGGNVQTCTGNGDALASGAPGKYIWGIGHTGYEQTTVCTEMAGLTSNGIELAAANNVGTCGAGGLMQFESSGGTAGYCNASGSWKSFDSLASGTTWANDAVLSTSSSQTISSLTGGNGSSGTTSDTVVVKADNLTWPGTLVPTFNAGTGSSGNGKAILMNGGVCSGSGVPGPVELNVGVPCGGTTEGAVTLERNGTAQSYWQTVPSTSGADVGFYGASVTPGPANYALLYDTAGTGAVLNGSTGSYLAANGSTVVAATVGKVTVVAGENVGLNGASSFGGGTGVEGMANAAVPPASAPSGGGIRYEVSGNEMYLGSGGASSTVGPAGYTGNSSSSSLVRYLATDTTETTSGSASTIGGGSGAVVIPSGHGLTLHITYNARVVAIGSTALTLGSTAGGEKVVSCQNISGTVTCNTPQTLWQDNGNFIVVVAPSGGDVFMNVNWGTTGNPTIDWQADVLGVLN